GRCNPTLYPHSDVVVTRLSVDGSALLYSTFLGGSQDDDGYGMALDSAGTAYLTGDTYSTDFPISPGAYDGINSGHDAFVARLSVMLNLSVHVSRIHAFYRPAGEGYRVGSAMALQDVNGHPVP